MAVALEIAVRGTALVYALAEGANVTVGRIGQCEIQLDDPSVSRRHCIITVRDGELAIIDLDRPTARSSTSAGSSRRRRVPAI